jgi:hypothetical protein
MQPGDSKPPAALPEVLRMDAMLRNTNNWKRPDDVFNRFFRFSDGKVVNNTAGFKAKSRAGGARTSQAAHFAFSLAHLERRSGPTSWTRKREYSHTMKTIACRAVRSRRLQLAAIGCLSTFLLFCIQDAAQRSLSFCVSRTFAPTTAHS